MAHPMIEWVLDTHYSHLFHQLQKIEKAVLVYDMMESALVSLMEGIETDFPMVKTYSLPKVHTASSRGYIELGVKGEPVQTEAAFGRLLQWMAQHKTEYQHVNAVIDKD